MLNHETQKGESTASEAKDDDESILHRKEATAARAKSEVAESIVKSPELNHRSCGSRGRAFYRSGHSSDGESAAPGTYDFLAVGTWHRGAQTDLRSVGEPMQLAAW